MVCKGWKTKTRVCRSSSLAPVLGTCPTRAQGCQAFSALSHPLAQLWGARRHWGWSWAGRSWAGELACWGRSGRAQGRTGTLCSQPWGVRTAASSGSRSRCPRFTAAYVSCSTQSLCLFLYLPLNPGRLGWAKANLPFVGPLLADQSDTSLDQRVGREYSLEVSGGPGQTEARTPAQEGQVSGPARKGHRMSLGLGLLTPVTHLRVHPSSGLSFTRTVGGSQNPLVTEKEEDLLKVTRAQQDRTWVFCARDWWSSAHT